ncbi:DUF1003 domain-containing protein [Sphingobacterium oryzagri]|uniref:DUF1003 domain-containing protein n=1 Tax=Sphingobacterium oryzagri TaxID=3025669 RepID=A0ABY7WT86_9SPHI|nr:DUF1003 domain-containing protein [Sphingobacterium sp. KACC 22765]WDF70529.1 DUF1003 domain-containing protein [Sphingobacterium sp. KACC 22765]
MTAKKVKNAEILKMMEQSDAHSRRLQEIVKKTIEEEQLIVDNLAHPPKEVLSRGQQVSDQVARFGGSWKFIILFTIILAMWILYNSVVNKTDQFDPYPFILMNLLLSCVAALQAPVIMMSQNRQEEKDRLRGENDYLINLKAEVEIRSLHEKLDILLEEQIKELLDAQVAQVKLLKELSVRIEKIEKKQQ